MDENLHGKTAVVTGGSAGIGMATARLLHDAGATVVLVARDVARLEAASGSVGSRAVPMPCDVTDTQLLPGLVNEVMGRCGSLDVLVNNAGVHHRGSMLAQSPDALAEMVSANLTAPIVLTRLVADVMGPGGRIVNVASIAGKIPVPGSATYSGTKAGLRFWALVAAEDLAERGIGVATVNPGPVLSDFHRTQWQDVSPISASQPWSTPERIAEAVMVAVRSSRSPMEVDVPYLSGKLATAAYAVPSVRVLRPLMQWRGQRALRRIAARRAHDAEGV